MQTLLNCYLLLLVAGIIIAAYRSTLKSEGYIFNDWY
jgi:hypothetical protein